MATTHIIGAGLAGLSAAVRLTDAGRKVIVYESSAMAGGRCRSFYSERLARTIDNGSHLILGANQHALDYIRLLGAEDRFRKVYPPRFPFVDAVTHETWTVKPDQMLPFGPWQRKTRIPATQPRDYLGMLFYYFADETNTVTGTYRGGPGFYRRFIGPLCFAALNTHPREASARQMWRVMADGFLKGAKASVAWVARESLGHALIDPAIEKIRGAKGEVRFSQRVRRIEAGERVTMLNLADDTSVTVAYDDTVILAVPPWMASELLPDLRIPQLPSSIVNVHYLSPELTERMAKANIPFIGVAGGLVHWLFFRGDIVSVTVSAAEGLVDQPADVIAAALWNDIRGIYSLHRKVPPCHVIKEKRATLKATPMVERLRPAVTTPYRNLFLAGCYVQTGLPCTIDGAIKSGEMAAARVDRADDIEVSR